MNTIGIAAYYRADYHDLITELASAVYRFLDDKKIKCVVAGKRNCKVDEIPKILRTEIECGCDDALVFTADNVYAKIIDANHIDTPYLKRIAIIVPADRFDVEKLRQFFVDTEVAYAYVVSSDSREGAYDEIMWPSQCKEKSENRMHNDTWIRLMKSFAKSDIGLALPDLYPYNYFGARLVSEILSKDPECKFEKIDAVTRLDNGAAIIDFTNASLDIKKIRESEDYKTLGDILTPFFIIQKALRIAKAGNPILLTELGKSGDKRLLLGLACEQGLDAFRILAPEAGVVNDVAEALAFLAKTRGERARCYGETMPKDETVTDQKQETPTQEPLALDQDRSSAKIEARVEAKTPVKDDLRSYRMSSVARGTLKAQNLLMNRKLEQGQSPSQELEFSLKNTIALPVSVQNLSLERRVRGKVVSVSHINEVSGHLLPGAESAHAIIPLPNPDTEENLTLLVEYTYRIHENILDLVDNNGQYRVLGDLGEKESVISTWPIASKISIDRNELILELRNTTQEIWKDWKIELASATQKPTVYDEIHPDFPLDSGQASVITLKLPDNHSDFALRVSLVAHVGEQKIIATIDTE